MKNILLSVTLLLSIGLHAQYYYNDIIGTQDINGKMKTYNAAKVQSVTAAGYDAGGKKTNDFNEWQDVQSGGSVLKTTTRNGQSVARIYYQFDTKTRLVNARDSSGDIQSITTYNYDGGDRLVTIKTSTSDLKQDFNETEERQWQYTPAGKPEKMWRILNGKDTTVYVFTLDEKGNVADEQLLRRAVGIDPVYYYYDESNRLTDIVRYNKKVKQLLPDIMFEYDDSKRTIQKTIVLSTNTRDYIMWLYIHDDKGLKTKEALFNKDKELRGRIEYTYSYAP
jgi:hypothetical protein